MQNLGEIFYAWAPQTCIYCQKPGRYVCFLCQSQLFEQYFFDEFGSREANLTIAFRYNRAIELFWKYAKHDGYYQMCFFAGELLGRELMRRKSRLVLENYAFVPVPISEQKLHERGFNQVQLMFQGMQGYLRREVGVQLRQSGLLQRVVDTKTQVGQNKSQRQNNLKSAFQVNPSVRIPQKVILLDDIYTTGTTTELCAQMLTGAGVSEVHKLVFARG